MNKKDAANRDHVFFINADREYRDGKAQNFLRPEDVSKIVQVYRTMQDAPGYARRVPVSEIAAEDYNCNIRRYVDNAPPPEPHDVRAHLHGGVPVAEIESLGHFWKNFCGMRERVFVPRSLRNPLPPVEGKGEGNYADFTPEVTDRRALAELVKNDPGVAKAHACFLEMLETWWQNNLSLIEALAPNNGAKGNVYELRRQLLSSITGAFNSVPSPGASGDRVRGNREAGGQSLLTDHQIRGAFARYMEDLKADLKSIAASGWGSELIPDDDILQSQFPELLAEMAQKRMRLAELTALFTAADEEDYEESDNTGVLPSDEVKTLKAELKEANAQAKLAKKEKRDPSEFLARVPRAEQRLAKHKALEDEARQLKNDLRATEKKEEELVAAAREKIDRDEARRVILDRLHRSLVQIYEGYLHAYQRACLAALENLHAKYAITANDIEAKREVRAVKLKRFLVELGYE
jgi:type I restriction enzyme M protein